VKGSLNWGKIETPSSPRRRCGLRGRRRTPWAVEGIVVDDINEFIDTRCRELTKEWRGK